MNKLKTMAIINIVIAGLAFLTAWYVPAGTEADGALGWSLILSMYTIAFSVVVFLQVKQHNK